MRRTLAAVACVIAILGFVAPPVLAQVPAPKVTITGLFDQVTSAGRNFYDGNYTRAGDNEWYARTRFRPDIEFAVGRTKAVLGLEIDLSYGQAGANDGGFPGNVSGTNSGCKAGANGCLDLNTDVGGMVEIKWIYTEFDLTGKDSLLPFIPIATVARVGGQPFATLANYRATYANGDFAGISAVSTWAPNLKTNLAYVQVEETLAGANRAPQPGGVSAVRGNDFAVIASPEFTLFKGLDVKALYSYFRADGTTSGSARRTVNDVNLAGSTTAAATTPRVTMHENRHTVGLDARWRSGPFSLDPTIYFQFGDRDQVRATGGVADTDLRSWMIDVQGGFQAGPLLIEARTLYTTGNKARDNLSDKIKYFEPLNLDTGAYAGWAQMLALGVDYFNGGGGSNGQMATNIGYDRYGRAQLGVRATYSLTPALAIYAIGSPTWTAELVDTDTAIVGGTRTAPTDGDSRYIGTEADLGMTWRFAPNVAFDLVGGYLFAGSALDATEFVNGAFNLRDSKNAWTTAARVRLSF
jgi:hypothetical protein